MRVSLCCLSIGRSVGVPPSRQSVLYLPRIGHSVGVPPSRQSVCQGASVSSSHRSLSWSTSLVCQDTSVLISSSRRSLSWSTFLPSGSLSGRLCIVLASVAQLEYLPHLSGRLCPHFILASVVQSEYVPHVSQSVSLSPQVHVRVYAYICVNIVYIFTLSFHTSLPSIPSISQSVSGPSWHAREADMTQVRNHRRPVAYTQGATAPCTSLCVQ